MNDTAVEIVRAAVKCFNQSGFERATFKEIAGEVGVTQPLLYKYFKDKMDLFAACGLAVAQEGRLYIDGAIDQRGDARARLRGYIDANIEWFGKNRDKAQVLLGVIYFAATDKKIAVINAEITRLGLERIETHLIQIGHESSAPYKDVKNLARIIHSLMVGEIIKLHDDANSARRSKAKELMVESVGMMLKSWPVQSKPHRTSS